MRPYQLLAHLLVGLTLGPWLPLAAQDAEPYRRFGGPCPEERRTLAGLEAGLRDSSPEVRVEVVRLAISYNAWNARNPKVVPFVLAGEVVRPQLTRPLTSGMRPDLILWLERRARYEDGATDDLFRWLADPQPPVREIAADVLGTMLSRRPNPGLLARVDAEVAALVKHPDPGVRQAAARVLGVSENPRAVSALSQPEKNVAEASKLPRPTNEQARALARSLGDADIEVVREAGRSLASFTDETLRSFGDGVASVSEIIAEHLRGHPVEVRRIAASILRRWLEELWRTPWQQSAPVTTIVPALRAAVQEADLAVRVEAIAALGYLRRAGEPAIWQIASCLTHPKLADGAAHALRRLVLHDDQTFGPALLLFLCAHGDVPDAALDLLVAWDVGPLTMEIIAAWTEKFPPDRRAAFRARAYLWGLRD